MGGGQSYNKQYEDKINELKREMLKMKETIEDYKKKKTQKDMNSMIESEIKSLKDRLLKNNKEKEIELITSFVKEFIENIDKNSILKVFSEENEKQEEKIYKTIKEKLNEFHDNISEKINHLNILIIGPTGVGKSTLINSILKLNKENSAEVGLGNCVTEETKSYTSNEFKYLRLYDTRGIDFKISIEESKQNIKNFINSKTKDIDEFIHIIWYCTTGSRFQDEEENYMKELINIYEENKLPIIIVYTQASKIKRAETMKDYIQKKLLNEEIDVIPILAVKDEDDFIEPYGIDQLMNKSIEKTENAIDSEYYIFIKENIKKGFIEQFEKKSMFNIKRYHYPSNFEELIESLNIIIGNMKLLLISYSEFEYYDIYDKNSENRKVLFESLKNDFQKLFDLYFIEKNNEFLLEKSKEIELDIEKKSNCKLKKKKSELEWKNFWAQEINDYYNEIKTHIIKQFYDLIVKILNNEFKTYLNTKINECFNKKETKEILKQKAQNCLKSLSEKLQENLNKSPVEPAMLKK